MLWKKVTDGQIYGDLCDKSAYIARVLHADIAHGIVKDQWIPVRRKTSRVVKIVTCFDVPKYYFPTVDIRGLRILHQDVKDRLLLTEHVRVLRG